MRCTSSIVALALAGAVGTLAAQQPPARPGDARQLPGFTSGVDLVNVTTTVSDDAGRFVPGLHQDDFTVFENNVRQELTYFSAERVPVSLGIVLDTSGSMAGEKMDDARGALDRFLYELLDERDEVFLNRFSDHPIPIEGWTTDRARLSRAISRITPNGGTALYDAVLESLPLVKRGHHQKKALLIISDGNDTSSIATLREVRDAVHDSEVLVYAVGIDAESVEDRLRNRAPQQPRFPGQPRSPFPPRAPGRPGGGRYPIFPQIFGPGRGVAGNISDEHVNDAALRDITDDSGGRTEIIRFSRDLNPATASIADELSKQYSLGYASSLPRDGRWHEIRVEVRDRSLRVRARRGYIAS
ncbi:MAG: VWA domain-containing protein [Vicinamibacterales bacterium]